MPLAVVLIGLASCSSSKTQAGTISITDPNGVIPGQLTSLSVATTAKVSMAPIADKINAGVDWAVTCGGDPITGSIAGGACGTLAPAHTPSGVASTYTAPSLIPLGTNVTISAFVTSNSAATSSVTLPVTPSPISVGFVSPPLSLGAGGAATLTARVLNDSTSAGVKWTATCVSGTCGSFNPASSNQPTTYTAPTTVPQGGTVILTATSNADPTKSASVTVTILAVSVGITPPTFYIATLGTATFVASLTNDTSARGVDWSVNCGSPGNCGTVTPSHTASGVAASFRAPSTAPAGNTVTITATSTAQPTQSAMATATITAAAPVSVTMTAQPPLTLVEGAQATLNATVANDPNSLGVDWTATCGSAGACGTFNLSPAHTVSGASIVYTAPAAIPSGQVVTIRAASPALTPANPAFAVTTITAPATVSFLQQPPANMTVNTQATVNAAVANDSAVGGVTWSVQCTATAPGACGYVTPYKTTNGSNATYIAPPVPPGGTVKIVATSTAFPAIGASSTPVVIAASTDLSIRFIPSVSSQLRTSSTVNLNAAVSNDSTHAGVDWQVCASGCGFFTVQPAIPEIPATPTTPDVPAVPAITATTVTAWPNGLSLPYTASATSGSIAMIATAHADGTKAAVASITIGPDDTGPALNGTVLAGAQPVAGAEVSLYAAGASGYGSASTLVYAPGSNPSVVTESDGRFTLPSRYSCPRPDSQMYLVAVRGRVGTNSPNPNLALMTALGPCNRLNSAPVVLNEVTTVAFSWALAPFAANDALTGNSSYLNIGSSNGNAAGLANAFASVNNLVDISTGQALFTVPAGNAAVPYAEINTLADILNTCTATGGGAEGDGSACGSLFTAADPFATTPLLQIAPVADTLQAAFNIAQHPANGFGYQIFASSLFSLIKPGAPFQPVLISPPHDFSIALNFTGGGGLSVSSAANFLAVDASGNLWITDSNNNSVIEWNGTGAALSPATGFTAGGLSSPGPIAIDTAGNVWVVSGNGLTEIDNLGIPLPGSPFTGVTSGNDMSIDASGNLWITGSNSVSKFNNVGLELSPFGGYSNSGITGIGPIAIDASNNVWIGNQVSGQLSLAELNNAGGQLIVNLPLGKDPTQAQIVADGSGNIWAPSGPSNQSALCEMPVFGGVGSVQPASCYGGGTPGGSTLITNLFNPRGLSLDGAGAFWIANSGGSSIQPNLTEVLLSQISFLNNPSFVSPTLAAGPLKVAVDGSGNVWVLLANNTVTEYVGVATPAVTPLSLAAKSNKIGAKP